MTPPAGHAEAEVKRPVQLRLTTEEIALVDAFAEELSMRSFGAPFSRAESLKIAAMEWLRQRQRDAVVILEPAVEEEVVQTIADSAGLPDPAGEELTPETPPLPASTAPPVTADLLPPDALIEAKGGNLDKGALAHYIRQMRQSMSHAKIAAHLNAEGIATPGGKPGAKWSNSAVARLETFGLQEA